MPRVDTATIGAAVTTLAGIDPRFAPSVFEMTADVRPGHGTLIVRGNHPGALIAKDASSYSIDMRDGRITSVVDARQAGWATYLYNVLDPLHFGYLGDKSGDTIGYIVKAIWALVGLTPGVLSITGGYMWLLRRRRSRAATEARVRLGHAAPVERTPPILRPPEWWASLGGIALFLLVGYWMQAAVWHRGWLSESLWQHWIIKPLCLTLIALPLTLAAMWLGGIALRSAGRLRAHGNGWPATSGAVALGLLGSVPLGLLYLAGTAVLN